MSTYSDFLLECFKEPAHKGVPEKVLHHSEEINTTCGDHIHLYQDKHHKLSWDGKGCMICLSSAEILCAAHNSGEHISEHKNSLVPKTSNLDTNFGVGALQQTLLDFPVRKNCVMLAWKAWEKLT